MGGWMAVLIGRILTFIHFNKFMMIWITFWHFYFDKECQFDP